MKHIKTLVPIIVIISLSLLTPAFAETPLGRKVPDFVTSTLDGSSFALTDWLQRSENRVLILSFLSTWCEVCDQDLKFMQKLRDRYADQGLEVVCIFTGRLSKIKAVKEHMERLEVKLPVLFDRKREISKSYNVTGFPCTDAIDREGFLRFRCLGCSEDVKMKFEKNLRTLLEVHDESSRKPTNKEPNVSRYVVLPVDGAWPGLQW